MEVELYSVNDLQKLCRLCMETGSELYSIYNLTPLDDMGLHIQFVEMIIECTSLNVECDDGLPKSACMECLNYLGTLYSFKQRCTKSDKKLRELIEIFKENKYEDLYEITENNSEELITIDCDDKVDIKKELKSTTTNKLKENVRIVKTKDQHRINKRKTKLKKRNISEENLECTFCFKKFTCETNLKLHLNACQTITVNCGVCSKNFPNTMLLKTHLAEVHLIEKGDNEDKICDICDAIFSDYNKLLFHYRMHIDMAAYFFDQKDDNSIICYYCYKHFINVTDFENHISVHTVDKSAFVCRLCGFESTEDRLVKNHLKSHGINPLICNLCLLSFISSRKFRLHLKTHKQINKLVYSCWICKENFSTRNEIKNHIKIHIKDLQTCSTCSKSFKNPPEYESHQKEHNKSILCTVCGKLFPGKSRLDSHMLLHDGIKPFSCSQCDKSFRTKTILSNHELTHSDVKPYVCTWCGYACRRSGDLHIHHRIHTGDRPYSCSFPGCNSTFKTSSFMHQHMRRHTGGGKIYSCELCNKTFTVADSLKRHMLIHSNVRPHKCDVCGKCFRRKYHVKVHKAKVHHQ